MNGQRGELYRMWFTNLHDFKFTLDLVVIRVLFQLQSELVDFSSLDAEQLEGKTLQNGKSVRPCVAAPWRSLQPSW